MKQTGRAIRSDIDLQLDYEIEMRYTLQSTWNPLQSIIDRDAEPIIK